MTTQFEFATATRIVFGAGSLAQAGTLIKGMGARALLVTGSKTNRALPLIDMLEAQFIEAITYPISSEPSVKVAVAGAERVRGAKCDLVIGFGGGSVIDAAKAIAAFATNDGDPLDYLETIGKGKPLKNPPLPFVAIPTTAGTGSEVTRNAVLSSAKHKVKVSLRSPLMLPRLALVDPELTYSVPPAVTAYTGMDALAQVLEPYVSAGATPITDAFCREALPRAARSLLRAYESAADPKNPDAAAREDMALVSLYGGLALANAKLGAAHGFAGPLGGMYDGAPHGALVAALLPHVMAVNIRALRKRQRDSQALRRYKIVATLLTGSPKASADDGAEWVAEMVRALNIPPLRTYGIKMDEFPAIVEKSAHSNSMKGNPITLTPDELTNILEGAW